MMSCDMPPTLCPTLVPTERSLSAHCRVQQSSQRILLPCLLLLSSLCLALSQLAIFSAALEASDEWIAGETREKHAADVSSEVASSRASKRGPFAKRGDGITRVEIPLEHGFTSPGFSPAGVISFSFKRQQGRREFVAAKVERVPFASEDIQSFQDLLSSAGFYRLRVPSTLSNSSRPPYLLSSIAARCLVAVGFKEGFELVLDDNNSPVSFTAASLPSSCSVDQSYHLQMDSLRFSSSVTLKASQQPETVKGGASQKATAAAGQGVEGAAKPKEPEKTFWQKYWFYILPVGLILVNALLSSGLDAPQGATTGGR